MVYLINYVFMCCRSPFVTSDKKTDFICYFDLQQVNLMGVSQSLITDKLCAAICLATDTPKRSGVQKKEHVLNGFNCTDF